MKTLDAIKLLPMDDAVKVKVITMYPYMEAEQKLSISSLAWDYYDALFGILLEENMERQYAKTLKGEEHLGKEYYKKAIKQTDEDIKRLLNESGTQADLAAARRAMDQIVKEMRDAKTVKKEIAANKLKPQ